MPLKPGTSNATVSSNIREMRHAGYPEDRAVAAAMREKDESKRKKKSRPSTYAAKPSTYKG